MLLCRVHFAPRMQLIIVAKVRFQDAEINGVWDGCNLDTLNFKLFHISFDIYRIVLKPIHNFAILLLVNDQPFLTLDLEILSNKEEVRIPAYL